MRALGVDGVELEEALPTALPAGELRADTVWRMTDGKLFHLEFQTQLEPTLYRFLEYDARLVRQYDAPIRTVILYHSSVRSAPEAVDLGMIQYHVENVYLALHDGDAALGVVAAHLATDRWEASDRLRLALALCMHAQDRRALFGQTLELIAAVPTPEEADLVAAAIMALAEPMLLESEMIRLEKELKKVSKILERSEQSGIAKGRQEGLQEGRQERTREIARAMLQAGDSIERVMTITGLSRAEVESLGLQ